MGYGDELMALGQAEELAREQGCRVMIVDRRGRPRWSELWRGNASVIHPEEREELSGSYLSLVNGPGARPYLASLSRVHGAVFTSYRARDHIGTVHLTYEERRYAQDTLNELGPFVVIEPTTAKGSNPNKSWPWKRWQAVVDQRPDVTWVQVGLEGATELLRGVTFVSTITFRHAMAVLSLATAAILPEGGLHHAAGVLGTPAVVVFGGHTSPETTGYAGHYNLFPALPDSPCGQWQPCSHCDEAMRRITVGDVLASLRNIT